MSAALEHTLARMKKASAGLASLPSAVKDKALRRIASALFEKAPEIIKANAKDLADAEGASLAAPLLKRLNFDAGKIEEAARGLRDLAALPDPVNRVQYRMLLDDGLVLRRVSVPIGVVAVIFESRPDALVQIASLCIKSGNCAVMKGGSEAAATNAALFGLIRDACLAESAAFEDCLGLISTRGEVDELLRHDRYINLVVPRGSNEFVRAIQEKSRIPVLGHSAGVCHVYVDKAADLDLAVRVTVDSKTQYPAVCNACECLLVHEAAAGAFLPGASKALREKKVRLKGCEKTRKILPDVEAAAPEDWGAEYLDLVLAVKVVSSIEEAVSHINAHGSGHTDAIVSGDAASQELFGRLVDSSSVMVNCSTRFADGYRYGMGAELGISTGKIHARGPVGLEGLTIYKYILEGRGHVVKDYSGKGAKPFRHEMLD